MATITSVQFYFKRTTTFVLGETITVNFYDSASSGTDPDGSDLLGSKTIDANDILLNVFSWVTFTFDAPIEITGDGFYGVTLILSENFSAFQALKIQFLEVNYSEPDTPYAGDELGYHYDYFNNAEWTTSFTVDIPYKILGTDTGGNNAVDLGADPFPNYGRWYRGYGIRSYIVDATPRQVILSSPTDEDTGIILQPLLEWTINGTGAEEGDYLFIYIRADDANFTENDLIGNFVEAEANTNLQIVAGLAYNTTYYWQVQAANEAADLLDSDVWSFTTTTFRPPAVPTNAGGYPIGINNMLTRKRFIAAANNRIWYEDI